MHYKFDLSSIQEYLPTRFQTGVALIIVLLTFPNFQSNYDTGIDGSYIWAFNYLFNSDYNALLKTIYPIGPLGFLRMPTTEGTNIIYAILFHSGLKFWFVTSFLSLSKSIILTGRSFPL